MGMLRQPSAPHATFVLRTETTIGRSPQCSLVLTDSLVSSIHASLRFTPAGWELKDLGSTNGSFVNGARISPAAPRLLRKGDKVAFGSIERCYELLECAAPGLLAASDGGAVVRGEGDLLAIPSAEEPIVCIYRVAEGDWFIEDAAGRRNISNGETFRALGELWHIALPENVERTRSASDGDVRDSTLLFDVSADEESVGLAARVGGAVLKLGGHACNYLLLTLARQRLKDRAAGLAEDDAGWLYLDELARGLNTVPEHLNVDVFRIRRRLGAHFCNAAEVIERRPGTRQLRIGVAELEVRHGAKASQRARG